MGFVTQEEFCAALRRIWNSIGAPRGGGVAPAFHHTQHESGGVDAIKLDDLAAPDDNTDLNASTTKHGLCQKLDGVVAHAFLGDGSFGHPLPDIHGTSHQSGGADAIKLDDLAVPDDNTDLNASTAKHGLEAKGTGNIYDVRLGNNTWGRYLRKTFVQLEDEFVGGSAQNNENGLGELGWDFAYTGSGGEAVPAPLAALDTNHIGVLNIRTANSTMAHSRIYLRGSVSPSQSLLPPSIDEVEFIVSVPTITECIVRVGLFTVGGQNVGGGSDNCSIWFDYDSTVAGNWYASSCGAVSDPGTTDTGIVCVAGNWYVLKIKRVSSAQWDFYINDVLKVSRTTKLPSEDKGFHPEYWVKTLRVASVYVRELYADYFRILSPVMPGNRYT